MARLEGPHAASGPQAVPSPTNSYRCGAAGDRGVAKPDSAARSRAGISAQKGPCSQPVEAPDSAPDSAPILLLHGAESGIFFWSILTLPRDARAQPQLVDFE